MERLAGRVILLWGWRRALVAFLAGALAALAQAPFDFPAVMFVSLPVLVWLLDGVPDGAGDRLRRRLAAAFGIGWWFGFGYFLVGLWWIGNALLVEADAFAWALPLAVVGLPAILALFYGLASLTARVLWSDGLGRILALAFAFGVAEWLRSFVLTGFPWNALGYAAMPVPVLMQSIDAVGVVAINALAVLIFAMPAVLADRRGRAAGLVLALALAAGHAGYGWWRLAGAEAAAADEVVRLRIVQPSIEQTQKWDAQTQDRIFETYLELSARPHADGTEVASLIVWPETAVPFLFTDRPEALTALGDLLADDQHLLAGAVRVEGGSAGARARYYNSLVAIDESGQIVDAFDKVHLVPFGEYMPLGHLVERFGISHIVQAGGPFEPGTQRRPLPLDGIGVLPFICYEIIFPGSAGPDAAGADMLLNVTNDAWFKDTPGPYQHFRQAQYRAVETRKPLARAANNGISGVVDAYGRVVDAYGLDAVGVLDISVPGHEIAGMRWDGRSAGFAIVGLLGMAALISRGRRRKAD